MSGTEQPRKKNSNKVKAQSTPALHESWESLWEPLSDSSINDSDSDDSQESDDDDDHIDDELLKYAIHNIPSIEYINDRTLINRLVNYVNTNQQENNIKTFARLDRIIRKYNDSIETNKVNIYIKAIDEIIVGLVQHPKWDLVTMHNFIINKTAMKILALEKKNANASITEKKKKINDYSNSLVKRLEDAVPRCQENINDNLLMLHTGIDKITRQRLTDIRRKNILDRVNKDCAYLNSLLVLILRYVFSKEKIIKNFPEGTCEFYKRGKPNKKNPKCHTLNQNIVYMYDIKMDYESLCGEENEKIIKNTWHPSTRRQTRTFPSEMMGAYIKSLSIERFVIIDDLPYRAKRKHNIIVKFNDKKKYTMNELDNIKWDLVLKCPCCREKYLLIEPNFISALAMSMSDDPLELKKYENEFEIHFNTIKCTLLKIKHGNDVIYNCINPDCDHKDLNQINLTRLKRINKEIIHDADRDRLECKFCDFNWCNRCRIIPYHTGQACRGLIQINDDDINEVNRVINGNYMACPKCNEISEKMRGSCDKMTCIKCNTKYCYNCGGFLNQIPGREYHHLCPPHLRRTMDPVFHGTEFDQAIF
jgi:hypothetical protein